jgi:hypothetical protein
MYDDDLVADADALVDTVGGEYHGDLRLGE